MAVETTAPEITLPPQDIEQSPETNHSTKKRKLSISADSPSASLHEVLTPVSGSRSSTPRPGGVPEHSQDLEIFDDGHSDYEWIRLPKARTYDLFKVARQAPSERDSAELPLVVRRETDGNEVVAWAKMDTGADCNVINRSTVRAFFGPATEKHLRTLTLAEKGDFSLVGNNSFHATHYTTLTFQAGQRRKTFDAVRFIVIPDDWEDSNGDGVPNVILGYPFLKANSMMMIDLDYHLDAEAGLEVVAERAEREKEGSRAILINMYAQTKGAPRPKKPRGHW